MLETFRSLANKEFNNIWIVENLISVGGWTFLEGETKLGKSMLCIQLCASLEEGKPFLGMQTQQQHCLYIQADAALVEWHNQIKALAPASKSWTSHQMELGFLDSPQERRKLHEVVWGTYTPEGQGSAYGGVQKALKGIPFTFVVFDCLHALTEEDLNTRKSMTRVLHHLYEITTRTVTDENGITSTERVHFLLIHHPNAVQKAGATSGAGNKGFSALCSTKLNLTGDNTTDPPTGMLKLDGSKLIANRSISLERDKIGAWVLPQEIDYGNLEFDDSSLHDEIPF